MYLCLPWRVQKYGPALPGLALCHSPGPPLRSRPQVGRCPRIAAALAAAGQSRPRIAAALAAAGQSFACSAAFSSPQVPERGTASTAPVRALRRNRIPSRPESSRALTTC